MSKILLYQNVESMVKVMPRIEALYYFVYELAESFHAKDNSLSIIEEGILDNQILQTITLLYKESSNEIVGKIVITIDWDKHFLLVKSDEGKFLEFDMSKSIVDNVVGWKKIVVTHIDQIMEQYNVKDVECQFTYRDSIYKDDEVLKEAREILGTSPVNKADYKENINLEIQKELNNILKETKYSNEIRGDNKKRTLGCGILEEVSVDVYYKV